MTLPRSLGAAQTCPVRGDVDANIDQHVQLVRVAAEESAQVLVFPELSLIGYELELAGDLAFSENDPRLSPLVEAACSHSITLIAGAPLRTESQLHIGAFIIAPDRTVEVYTKHHLGAFSPNDNPDGSVPPAEATVFAPGRRNPLVRFGDTTAAVAVCADCTRPSHAQKAAERGANAYLAGTFTIESHLATTTAGLRTYAERHSMVVVFSNYGGPSGGLASGGRSAIWSDSGKLLAELEAIGSGVVVAVESGAGWRAKAIMGD